MSTAPIPGGYILLSRKLIESKVWEKPPLYLKIWVYLLSKAQHQQFRGLRRGQLRTTVDEIREDCAWYVGYRKERPSYDQVYGAIQWLRDPLDDDKSEAGTNPAMITTTKATQGLLITIVNYDVYQDPKNYEANTEAKGERGTTTERSQLSPNNTNKNVKNDKNVKKDSGSTPSTKPTKVKYAETVTLTETEYQKLIEQHGEADTARLIDILNNYKLSSGKKYKSDYHAILNWVVKRLAEEKSKGKQRRNYPQQEQGRSIYDDPDLYRLSTTGEG